MWHDWLPDTSFLQTLVDIDEKLLHETRRQLGDACKHCGGPLHRGDYPRKPRGLPERLEEAYARRFSLCSAVIGTFVEEVQRSYLSWLLSSSITVKPPT